jgi:hypothetical protein
MSVDNPPTNEIADLEKRLAELDRERVHVLAVLEQLKRRAVAEVQPSTTCQMAVAVASSTAKSDAERLPCFVRSSEVVTTSSPAGGKLKDWQVRLCSSMPQRMGSRHL